MTEQATVTLTNVASATVTIEPDATVASVTTTSLAQAAISILAFAVAQGGGSASASFGFVEFSGLAAGQTVALGALSTQLSLFFLNGLLQSPSNYSISGSTLTIPPGFLDDGCDCFILFQKLQ